MTSFWKTLTVVCFWEYLAMHYIYWGVHYIFRRQSAQHKLNNWVYTLIWWSYGVLGFKSGMCKCKNNTTELSVWKYCMIILAGGESKVWPCDLLGVYLKILVFLRMKSCHSRDCETVGNVSVPCMSHICVFAKGLICYCCVKLYKTIWNILVKVL